MKRILCLIIPLLLMSACTQEITCRSENDAVCEIEKIGNFEIEEDATITIGVFDEQYGQRIIEELEKVHPNIYTYQVIDPDNLESIRDLDIAQVKLENVPLIYEYIDPISEQFEDYLENEYLKQFSGIVNQEKNYFVPLEIKGLLFAYNKTMLESFGLNLTDTNNDGLPESIDSFEKIGQLAKQWKKEEIKYLDEPLNNVFSFPFNDQLSMISFIENSDYKLVDGISGEYLRLDESLLEALKTFQGLGEYPWNFKDMSDMKWDYEEALLHQSSPFLLVGNWMFYERYQASQAYELVFSRLPQINESDIRTLSNVSGFVLKKDSLYPNAQNEFLKFIKDKRGVEVAIEVGEIPIIDPLLLESLDEGIDPNVAQQIKAYTYSKSIDLQAFDMDPSIRAFDIYYDLDFREIWKDLFLNKIDAEEAQKLMIEKIKPWLSERNLEAEGLKDEMENNHKQSEE